MSCHKKKRCCRILDSDKIYKPIGTNCFSNNSVEIFLDEFEAMRLCDHEKLSQIEASEKMNISRGTVQRLLETGRYKLIDALLNDKLIIIKNKV
jgi:predicted DNA-binding protein (UPF0251 family)